MATKQPPPRGPQTTTGNASARPAAQPAPREAARPANAPRTTEGEGVKVRATALCYYGDARRRIGDVFVISDERIPADETVPIKDKDGIDTGRTKPHPNAGELRHFNPSCMELVDAREPERTTGPQAALDRETNRIRTDGGAQGGESPARAGTDVLGD